jgi:hypothetical protein
MVKIIFAYLILLPITLAHDYWLVRAQTSGKKVRILTANDDFLNEPNVWKGIDNALVVEDGGHYGHRSLPWIQSFLDASY